MSHVRRFAFCRISSDPAGDRLEDEVEELREAQDEADRELRNDLEDQLRGPYRKWITNQVLAELEDE